MQAFNPDREFFNDDERLSEALDYLESVAVSMLRSAKAEAAWFHAFERAARAYGFAVVTLEAAHDRRTRAYHAARGLDF